MQLGIGTCRSNYLCGIVPKGFFPTMSNLRDQIGGLSVAEKIELLDLLWESLEAEAENVPLSEAQRAELDYRIGRHEQNPSDVIPWEQVRAGRLRSRDVAGRLAARGGCGPARRTGMLPECALGPR